LAAFSAASISPVALDFNSHATYRFNVMNASFAELRPTKNEGCFLFAHSEHLHTVGVVYHFGNHDEYEFYKSLKADILFGSFSFQQGRDLTFVKEDRIFFPNNKLSTAYHRFWPWFIILISDCLCLTDLWFVFVTLIWFAFLVCQKRSRLSKTEKAQLVWTLKVRICFFNFQKFKDSESQRSGN
jgi:hypothetical protein